MYIMYYRYTLWMIPTNHVLYLPHWGGECACSPMHRASHLQQLQGILHILLAAIWDNGLRPNVHVKERCAEVPAVQAYAGLGVCKVCEAWGEQASCQTAIFCNAQRLHQPSVASAVSVRKQACQVAISYTSHSALVSTTAGA